MLQAVKIILWHVGPFFLLMNFICVTDWLDVKMEYKVPEFVGWVVLGLCSVLVALFPLFLKLRARVKVGLFIGYFLFFLTLHFFGMFYVWGWLTGDWL